MDSILNLLGKTYGSISPALNLASATCSLNGQPIPCDQFFGDMPVVGAALGFFAMFWIISLAVCILLIIAMWKLYEKAGQPGWASIIPVYNMVIMLHIVKRPIWWIILYFIPLINTVVGFIVVYEFTKAFGKGIGFTLGLIFLPFIFYPILAFSDATYQGEKPPPMPFQTV